MIGFETIWRDRRLHSPQRPGRYLVELTVRAVPHLTVGVRTWQRDSMGHGRWLDEKGTAEGVFLDECDWFVLFWRELPSIVSPTSSTAAGRTANPCV